MHAQLKHSPAHLLSVMFILTLKGSRIGWHGCRVPDIKNLLAILANHT